MKNIKLIFLTLLLLIAGCSHPYENHDLRNNTKENQEIALQSETFLTNEIKQLFEKKYASNITLITLDNIKHIEESTFTKVLFTMNQKDYEGIAYSYKLNGKSMNEILEITEIDKASPLTLLQVTGETKDDIKRNFICVSGYLNNTDIQEIRITYLSNELSVIKLSENQKTYLDVRIGENKGVKEILALSKDGKEIFNRRW